MSSACVGNTCVGDAAIGAVELEQALNTIEAASSLLRVVIISVDNNFSMCLAQFLFDSR